MADYLPLSALQHIAYCPRQFALIHVEQVWAENRHTAEGRILHERVDSGEAEQRGDVRFERSVLIRSDRYLLTGKLDLLEIHHGDQFVPVEYKRGKPKQGNWDKVQVCAQALCIEELRNTFIHEGAIWYWEIRKRLTVPLTESLRNETLAAVEQAHYLFENGITPPPTIHKNRCISCSLRDICQPKRFRQDRSKIFVEELFRL